jgi:hypothetical protein
VARLAVCLALLALSVFTQPALGTWQAPAPLSGVIVENRASASPLFNSPQVGMDGAGNAIAAWETAADSPAPNCIETAVRPAGGAWLLQGCLTGQLEHHLQPQLAVNPAGDAVFVWRGGSAVKPRGHGWRLLALPVGDDPRVATDASGNAIAVWGSGGISSATYSASSGSWRPVEALSSPGVFAQSPSVAVDPGSIAAAVWAQGDVGARVIVTRSRRPGQAWQPQEQLAGAPGQSFERPSVAAGPNGDLVAVWDGTIGTLAGNGPRVGAQGRQWVVPGPGDRHRVTGLRF